MMFKSLNKKQLLGFVRQQQRKPYSAKENSWLFRISVSIKEGLIHSLNIGQILVKVLESTGNLLSEFSIARKNRIGFIRQ